MADYSFLSDGIGNAFASGIGASSALRDSRRKADLYSREEESRQYIEPALGGDTAAFGKLAAANPQVASSVATMLGRLDEKKKAAVKDAAEFTTQMGMGVLNAPPEAQASAYEAARAEAQKRGMDITSWPTAWGPQAQGWVQFNVNKAIPVQEWFKGQEGKPTPLGGGGAPSAAPAAGGGTARTGQLESGGNYSAVNPTSGASGKYQFMKDTWSTVAQARPELGLPFDPRQATAEQQETAKKGLDELNGKGLQTAGIPVNDATLYVAHRFGVKGAQTFMSAPDNASIASIFPPSWIQQNPDLQNKTVGQFKQFVAQNFGGSGQQPTMGTPPPQIAQAGTGAAPMPAPPPGMAVPGNPATMPQPPMGAAPPSAGGQGDSLPGQMPGAPPPIPPEVRGVQLPPGAQMMGIKGVPVVKDGTVLIRKQDGSMDWVPLPQRKDPGQSGGPFGGTSVEAQALNMLIANGTLSQQQAAELAAGKTITNPADGSVMFMTPSGIFQRPAGAPAPGAQPVPAGQPAPATPSGNIPITPPKPQTMTEGQANAALYADRMRSAEKIILENQGAAQGIEGIKDRALNSAPGGLGTLGQSESFQKLDQAQRDFINAVLRRESGAVISPEEFDNARKQYFPVPGNPESVLKQKAENRRIALEGISRAAGPTYKKAEGPADKGKLLFDARKAIEQGAPRDAVINRLKEMGVEEQP